MLWKSSCQRFRGAFSATRLPKVGASPTPACPRHSDDVPCDVVFDHVQHFTSFTTRGAVGTIDTVDRHVCVCGEGRGGGEAFVIAQL